MVAELRASVGRLDEPWRGLTAHILLDEQFLPSFMAAPAARTMHHAFFGGLLEHTLSMVALGEFLADRYDYVNKSLLLAGILLHDAGKVRDYELAASFEMTDHGRLIGHILEAIRLVHQAVAELGTVSEEQLGQIIHLLASHHGSLEWGSPVAPKTLEAILLHQIDLLDSRVQGFFDHLRADPAAGRWTSRPSPMLGAELRRPEGFE
jgi:3'-5' exoribonuclease